MTVAFRILGALEVVRDGERVDLGSPRQRALLALLLTRANATVSRDRLIDELWEDELPESVVNVLQTYVSRLRRVLPPDRLVSRPPGYALVVADDELDLRAFEHGAQDGRRLLAGGDVAGASESFRRALSLWRGPALEDVGAMEFARIEAARLEELRLAVLEDRIEAELALGHHGALVPELETLVREHPLRERLRAQLMLALYRSGRQPDALAVYRDARSVLTETLGIEPGHPLRALEAAILRQDPSLDVPAASVGTSAPTRSLVLVSLDERRLDALLAAVEPLARQPGHELVLVSLVSDPASLGRATRTANEYRSALSRKDVQTRAAAFTSADLAGDVLRLAARDAVLLLAVDGVDALDEDGRFSVELSLMLQQAACDVAVLAGGQPSAEPRADAPVVVPFGGSEHEWAAAEIGAWIAQVERRPLRLVGTVGDPTAGRRDASRLLASVSLLVQQVSGVETESALSEAGVDGAATLAADAHIVLVGLPDDWRGRGAGRTRARLAARVRAPVFLVRGGVRPGGLAPEESLTRFTWTLGDLHGS